MKKGYKGYITPLIILFAFVGVIALPSLLKDDESNKAMSIEEIEFSSNEGAKSTGRRFLCDKWVVAIDSKDRLMFTSFEKIHQSPYVI